MKAFSTIVLVSLILLAFAANSLLCRWALLVFDYSPFTFTLVRVASGAVTLVMLLGFLPRETNEKKLGLLPLSSLRFWLLGLSLFIYALMFSLAYVKLDTGIGAFILFSCVQLALLMQSRFTGSRFSRQQLVGSVLATSGLALLLLPGSGGSDLFYGLLMLCAAMAWAGFVLLGKGSDKPLVDVSSAFVSASILMLSLFIMLVINTKLSLDVAWFSPVFLIAVLSGSVMSGIAYFLWYRVLPIIGIERAAQLQLLVPVFAVIMGAQVLGEHMSALSWVGCGIIISGVWLFLRSSKT